jgi:HAD superfamily hydrolase (TIGR01459 family)
MTSTPLPPVSPAASPILDHLGPLFGQYDVLFCDIWGVVHDGKKAYPGANDALPRFRAGGGTVILVTNAPMPSDEVARVCDSKGVGRYVWDVIVSSGDIALTHIAEKHYTRLHRIGRPGFDDLFFKRCPGDATSIAEADAIVCTGLQDERKETAEKYRARLIEPASRGLPFVCANPDLAVHVGHELLQCAGAIAAIYEELGGPVFWAGKPHRSAYATAHIAAEKVRGKVIPKSRVLAIGDAVRTDLASAAGAEVDALFVASGLHRDEIMPGGVLDEPKLRALLKTAPLQPKAVTTKIVW